MNSMQKNWKQFIINEAGLSKIRQDMSDYDTAFITAFRGDIHDKSECLYIPPKNKDLRERSKMGRKGVVNRRNNKELSAYLLSQGYGIKNVQGSYIENFQDPDKVPREVKENLVNSELNKSVDELYGKAFDKKKTEECTKYIYKIIPSSKKEIEKLVRSGIY